MARASDFQFGKQLGFVKVHHKITRRKNGGHGPGLGELLNILWFHFNTYTMTEAKDFKFGIQLGFANAHHKTTPRGKMGVAMGWGSFHIFGVFLQYFCNGRAVLLALTELLVCICQPPAFSD